MFHVDIPTRAEVRVLATHRSPACVSLSLPTTPLTQDIGAARTTLRQLVKAADAQLEEAGVDKRTRWAVEAQLSHFEDDEDFWATQSNGLAIYATPTMNRVYRLPTHLQAGVEVSDRFHLKPLLRAMSVGQHAFVLALEENAIRLVEVFADLPPREVKVPGMPKDAATAIGTASLNSRSASGRIQGDEGQNLRLRQFVRIVDAALRPVLSGREEPLILAAADPLRSLFGAANNYPHLAEQAIETSPAQMSEADLDAAARPVLDGLHAARLSDFFSTYSIRETQGRATADIAQAARAATFGAVETLLVDIDEVVPGWIDRETGAVTFTEGADATTYGIVDEIAARTLGAGGEVLGVRGSDLPEGASLAAVLRYPV